MLIFSDEDNLLVKGNILIGFGPISRYSLFGVFNLSRRTNENGACSISMCMIKIFRGEGWWMG